MDDLLEKCVSLASSRQTYLDGQEIVSKFVNKPLKLVFVYQPLALKECFRLLARLSKISNSEKPYVVGQMEEDRNGTERNW